MKYLKYNTRRGRRGVIRKKGKTARKSVASIKKKVDYVARVIKPLIDHETYFKEDSYQLSTAVTSPVIVVLSNPLTWTRTFATLGTTTLETKSRVDWTSIYGSCHFSLQSADPAKSFRTHLYIVRLTKQGNALFPNGITTAGFVDGQTHKSNTAATNCIDQLLINTDLFKVVKHRSWTWGGVIEGAGNAVTNVHDSTRTFNFSLRFKKPLSIMSNLDSWKVLVEGDLPYWYRYYILVWCSQSGGYTVAPNMPQMRTLEFFKLKTAG